MTDLSVISEDGPFTVGFLLASQLVGYGRYGEADHALGHALDLATADDQVAMAAAVRASNRFWRLKDAAGAHAVLDEAVRRVGARSARDGLLMQRALLLLFEGRTVRALALSRGVRRRGATTDVGLLLGAGVEVLSRGVRGQLDDLPRLAGFLASAAPPAGDGLQGFHHGVLGLTLCWARSMNGLDPGHDGVPLASPARVAMDAACEGTGHLLDGSNLLWAGRVRRALPVLERAADLLRGGGRLHTEPAALGELAYAHALLGDAEGATRAAEEAGERRLAVNRFETFYVDRGRAWAAGARGERSAAVDMLVVTAGSCERSGQPVLAAQAWYDVARFGEPDRAADPLLRLAATAPGSGVPGGDPLVPMLAAHVAALVEGDAVGVGRAATRARQRGHLLHAAEAAAQAARLHGSRRGADARRWADVARTLLDTCEGVCSPALDPLADVDLTPREREVVGLAARGLSNPDIARRLHLSVRTVENHVQSVYGKLGVHRREELADLHPFGAGSPRVTARSAVADGDGAGPAVHPHGGDGG